MGLESEAPTPDKHEKGVAPGRWHSFSRCAKNGTRVQLSKLQRGKCESFDFPRQRDEAGLWDSHNTLV